MRIVGGGRVGILDFDFHIGDGTEDILDRAVRDYPLRDVISHVTGVGYGMLNHGAIEQIIDEMDVEMIIYQAGADQHIDDPLGGLFDDEEMRERDRRVFAHCKEREIPIAYCLAGGYRVDSGGGIAPVLKTHRNTMEECIKVFGL